MIYKKYLVKTKTKCVKYLRAEKNDEMVPVIDGSVKLYGNYFSSFLIFEGEMRKSKFDGFGKLYNKTKIIYEG